MDENSRIILVDGAHAVGKTELAKQLAEEFDMKYQPFPRMSDYYINIHGDDLNDYSVYIKAWIAAMAVKLRDPPCQQLALVLLTNLISQVAPG